MPILLIQINPGLQITGFLPVGTVGDTYSATIAVRGGLEPYIIRVVSALPDGLTWLDNGDGTLTISGTPTEAFDGAVIVQAADGLRKLVQRSIALTVNDVPAVPEYLLLENEDLLLLESGDRILLE